MRDWDREHLWHYRAKLIRVIDGDTIVVLVDTGFYGRHEAHIRLQELNAPELGTPEGEESKEKMIDALWDTMAIKDEWPLRIVTLQRDRITSEVSSFERFVGEVFLSGSMVSLVDKVREKS